MSCLTQAEACPSPGKRAMTFTPYTPPNEGEGLLSVDRDLCWRLNPRGLVTPAVIGAVAWARNNFSMSDSQHQSILDGLGLEYRHIPDGVTVLQPQLPYRMPPAENKTPADFFNLTDPQMPLHHYDAVEVYPCVESESGIERYEVDEHPEATNPDFWSVALHLEIGHIETVADFPEWHQAEIFGDLMRSLLRSARQAKGLDTALLVS